MQKNEQLRQLREKQQKEALAKKKKEQRLMLIISVCTIALILIAVGVSILVTKLANKSEETTPEETTTADLSSAPIQYDLADTNTYTTSETATNYVKLNVSYTADNGQRYNGDIIVELDPENAPITVANFQKLVGEGFYDGLIFHRVIENFMIQGGDPKGNGTGGSDEDIKGEFTANGVNNTIKHERGVISMARSGEHYNENGEFDNGYDSASSQFFIVHKTTASLDGKYAAFGHVVFGMTSVDGIATVATNSNDKPLKTAKIESAVFVNYTAQSE